MSKIKQIVEGWKNNLTPTQLLDQQIIDVSTSRMSICKSCDQHSANKENYKSIRVDAHCTNCGCTLSAKTKCLSCECPLNKWLSVTKQNNDELT
jgi:hypothetical protein